MEWHWDEGKAKANKIKHGVSFELAVLVFEDPALLTFPDDHSDDDRWRSIGCVSRNTLLVVHTIYDDDSGGRIISARNATPFERRSYDK